MSYLSSRPTSHQFARSQFPQFRFIRAFTRSSPHGSSSRIRGRSIHSFVQLALHHPFVSDGWIREMLGGCRPSAKQSGHQVADPAQSEASFCSRTLLQEPLFIRCGAWESKTKRKPVAHVEMTTPGAIVHVGTQIRAHSLLLSNISSPAVCRCSLRTSVSWELCC